MDGAGFCGICQSLYCVIDGGRITDYFIGTKPREGEFITDFGGRVIISDQVASLELGSLKRAPVIVAFLTQGGFLEVSAGKLMGSIHGLPNELDIFWTALGDTVLDVGKREIYGEVTLASVDHHVRGTSGGVMF